MATRWTISILLTLFFLGGMVVGLNYLDDFFKQYMGSGQSTLASVEEPPEAIEVGGSANNDNNEQEQQTTQLKDVIRKNQPKVVQIERGDGGLGSGFIYNEKGDIITNAHVVEGESTVLVRMPDTQTYYGSVIGIGDVVDVAVVRVPELSDIEPMSISTDFEGEIGDEVIAMGSPRGYQNTVTTGIISAINRDFDLYPYSYEKVNQISAPISQGSSGGPLLLASTGEVVGINSADFEGEVIGFSIPIKNIWSLVTAWSAGEHPIEAQTTNNTMLNEEEVSYLVDYFYENITNYDYLGAYALLGSVWQSSITYDKFSSGYLNTISVHIREIKATTANDVITVVAVIEAEELNDDGQYATSVYQVKYEVGIENDRLRIISGEGKKL